MPRCCCCCCCGNNGNTNNDTNMGSAGANPVGTVIYAHILQPGYVKANGQLLSRRDFPELYKYASENSLVLSELDWANEMQGMFAEGDGVNTFRVPDFRGQFLRALDDGAGVDANRVRGSVQGDAIRNITGEVKSTKNDPNWIFLGDAVGANGAFGIADEGSKTGISHNATINYGCGAFDFDASRIVPTAEENRPKNIALIAQIKY